MDFYAPLAERTPDTQYRDILKLILEKGVRTHNKFQTTARITHLNTPNMVFDLRNGFPMITERDVSGFFRKPIAEVRCFMHGAQTLDEFRKIGGKYWPSWWARWVTAEKCEKFGLPAGDLGPGSYGPGFVRRQPDGTAFNQFVNVVQQMKDYPWVTTHRVTPWIPELTLQHKELQRKVVVAPCHGDLQITIIDGVVHVRMDQRSGDFPVGVPSNMIQWADWTIKLAHVTGLKPGTYTHSVHDAHMYENQTESVEELLKREPRILPTLRIKYPNISDLLAFIPEDVELSDYDPHPAMNDIPVTE